MARFPQSGGRFKGRRPGFKQRMRTNERIRVREVRLIGPDSRQIGIVPTYEALRMAKQHGLDLVEISASARPPVCRILDFGKYKYELSKKGKDNKPAGSKIKEVKLRVRIEQHDFMVKLRRAEHFLDKGFKVKLTLSFRGRENEHKNLGFDVIKRTIVDLEHIGIPDSEARLAGRSVTIIVSPLPENKRKIKYNEPNKEAE